jgi:DNA end-binding protein Ku
MPTAVWTGSLSLGLVVIPVRVYPAIRKKTPRFHELDAAGRRVRHVRVSQPQVEFDADFRSAPLRLREAEIETEPRHPEPAAPSFDAAREEVSFDQIRKGFEVAPGQYVSLTREEVAALAPERNRVIEVEQFVDVSAVDPIYFESRYYLVPDRQWSSPFQVLRRAMAAADRMAIAWFTLRSRRYLCSVRPFGDVMLLTTMVHADEVLAADFWISDADSQPSEKELKMARLLIDTLAGPFEPERYPDEYRERVVRAIGAKSPREADEQTAPSPTRVLDLMAALQASVKAAKAARAEQDGHAKAPRRQSRGS